MAYDRDTESSETKTGKPLKRVRFSEEVQNVYIFAEYDENSRSLSLKDESNKTFINSSAGLERREFYSKETTKDDKSSDHETVNEDTLKISDRLNLSSYYDEVNEITNSLLDNVSPQNCENSISVTKECNPFASNVTNDMDELINHTMHMAISPTESTSPLSHSISTGEPSLYSFSSEASSEKKVETLELDSEQENYVTVLSRKRSLEGMIKGKQTAKLNTCLRKNQIHSEINSANELKDAVYNAWYKVKNEKAPAPSSQFIPDVKKSDSAPKTTPNDAFDTWQRSKRKVKKVSATKKLNLKASEPTPAKTQEEIEENKMAFRAWKKKKDELSRHQLSEKYRKEEKERLDTLMNERIRKNDAESAYSA